MTEILFFSFGFLLASVIFWMPKSKRVNDYEDESDLYVWLRKNDGQLYSRCVVQHDLDEVRQILNKVTGLQILPTDLIYESEHKFLDRLKEMKEKGEL